jgi:hypothetical protein
MPKLFAIIGFIACFLAGQQAAAGAITQHKPELQTHRIPGVCDLPKTMQYVCTAVSSGEGWCEFDGGVPKLGDPCICWTSQQKNFRANNDHLAIVEKVCWVPRDSENTLTYVYR